MWVLSLFGGLFVFVALSKKSEASSEQANILPLSCIPSSMFLKNNREGVRVVAQRWSACLTKQSSGFGPPLQKKKNSREMAQW